MFTCGYNRGRIFSDMQPRSSFDRTLLIPVVISIVSILGICLVFLASGVGRSAVTPTVIPSRFSPLEAATRTPSPSATSTDDEIPLTTGVTRFDAALGPATETPPSTSTVITESLSTPSATPTPARIQPLQ